MRSRVARGGVWLFGLRAVEQILRIGRLVVLARILAPDDFGLMGLALLTLATLQTFSESGFHTALIQKKGSVEAYLNTVWTVQVLRGAALAGLMWLVAPAAVVFFDAAEALPLIRVIALALFLQGFTNVAVVLFQRELEFHRQFAYQAIGTFVDFVVVVGAALWLRSVWALVIGLLAGELARVIGSYAFHAYRPRFAIDRAKIGELWRYGRWIFGSTILVFLCTQGDDIVVGRVLGTAALGFYQLAYRISNLPATEFSRLVAQVTFPAFAKIQGNTALLREGYLKVLQVTTLFAAPISAAVFLFAEDFTHLVLTDKWLPMVPALRVLALLGLLRGIASPGPLFLALGKPQLRTWVQTAGLVVLAGAIVPLTWHWGIVGAAAAATLGATVSTGAAISLAVRLVDLPVGRVTASLLLPVFNASLAMSAVHAIRTHLLAADGIWQLALLGIAFALIYALLTVLTDPLLSTRNVALLREQLDAVRRR